MNTIWRNWGYTDTCGEDGFPHPGKLIKQYRGMKRMSQEQLALELGCSRVMVTRMENENLGLNDIQTRRQISQILGIAPVMLGLASPNDVQVHTPDVYQDMTLLKKSLILHREVYFSSGNTGGLREISKMIQHLAGISKSINHKNTTLLSILCHYGQLGIDVAREECNYWAVERYAKWARTLAQKLNDSILLATTLVRHSAALYEKGDIPHSRQYVDGALAQLRLPQQLLGGILLDAGRIYARLGEPGAMKHLEKASNIARRATSEEDIGFIKLTVGFYHLRTAQALLNRKDYGEALETLDLAEEQTVPNMLRRSCSIQLLQAEALLGQRLFNDAAMCVGSALNLAITINSSLNLSRIATLLQQLKESPIGRSKEVIKLVKTLSRTVEISR